MYLPGVLSYGIGALAVAASTALGFKDGPTATEGEESVPMVPTTPNKTGGGLLGSSLARLAAGAAVLATEAEVNQGLWYPQHIYNNKDGPLGGETGRSILN